VESAADWQLHGAGKRGARLIVCATLPPATLASSVLSVLRQLNPRQPAAEFVTLQTLVDHTNSPRRFFTMLVSAFAALGIYTQADLRVAILFSECIGDLSRAGVRVQRPGNGNLARENTA